MVAVAIQPNTSAMRAQGRTFVLAIPVSYTHLTLPTIA